MCKILDDFNKEFEKKYKDCISIGRLCLDGLEIELRKFKIEFAPNRGSTIFKIRKIVRALGTSAVEIVDVLKRAFAAGAGGVAIV